MEDGIGANGENSFQDPSSGPATIPLSTITTTYNYYQVNNIGQEQKTRKVMR